MPNKHLPLITGGTLIALSLFINPWLLPIGTIIALSDHLFQDMQKAIIKKVGTNTTSSWTHFHKAYKALDAKNQTLLGFIGLVLIATLTLHITIPMIMVITITHTLASGWLVTAAIASYLVGLLATIATPIASIVGAVFWGIRSHELSIVDWLYNSAITVPTIALCATTSMATLALLATALPACMVLWSMMSTETQSQVNTNATNTENAATGSNGLQTDETVLTQASTPGASATTTAAARTLTGTAE